MDTQTAEPATIFRTSRVRAAIVAPIATLLFLGFVPRDLDYSEPVGTVVANGLCLLFLVIAVRAWISVLRRRSELLFTAGGLTIKRGRRELSAPWAAVSQIKIDRHSSRPWVVVWLDPSIPVGQVPVARRSDGSCRVLPVGHGRSVKKRFQQFGQLRAAIMTYGGRYIDPVQ